MALARIATVALWQLYSSNESDNREQHLMREGRTNTQKKTPGCPFHVSTSKPDELPHSSVSGPTHFVPNPCFSTWTEHNVAVIPVPVPSLGMETKINVKGPQSSLGWTEAFRSSRPHSQ